MINEDPLFIEVQQENYIYLGKKLPIIKNHLKNL